MIGLKRLIDNSVEKYFNSHNDLIALYVKDYMGGLAKGIKKEVTKDIEIDCKKIVDEIFMEVDDSKFDSINLYTYRSHSVVGNIKRKMYEGAAKVWEDKLGDTANRHMEGESFIDTIIERIQRKQL